MSSYGDTISAFAVHAAKRKSTSQPSDRKKTKRKLLSRDNSTLDLDLQMRKDTKHAMKAKSIKKKNKRNVTAKNGCGVVTKKNTLKTKKRNTLLSLNAGKSVEKMHNLNNEVQTLSNGNSRKNTHKEPKSKVTSEKKKRNGMSNLSEGISNTIQENGKEDNSDISNNSINDEEGFTNFNENPIINSRELFKWLIHPVKINDFFLQHWEKTPVHIKRNKSNYYEFLMSTPLLDKVLREQHVLFTTNLDITSYHNGVRRTHNPPGRAVPSVVWDYYQNDCSVRMLNPQNFIQKLHILNATLQEFFGCYVGANSYLTPPNSQGFAPHYDDIEAFVLQIEGKKRWRLYKTLSDDEYLPRYSSKNFDQSEVGEPILDTVLNAGDLLYFPRGTIHQAETIDNTHSLHITLSVYQKNSWCDLFEKLLPHALKQASETDSRFREGLPIDYLRYTGSAHSTYWTSDSRKSIFKAKLHILFNQLINYLDVDNAADLMAKNHIFEFLPPVFTAKERKCSVIEDGEFMTANGVVKNRVEIQPNTRIRLFRSHCIRLIEEDEIHRIYYSTENIKDCDEYEPQFFEVSEEFVPAIKEIIVHYPEYLYVAHLPIKGESKKIQIVKDLWERGLVITDVPLVPAT